MGFGFSLQGNVREIRWDEFRPKFMRVRFTVLGKLGGRGVGVWVAVEVRGKGELKEGFKVYT